MQGNQNLAAQFVVPAQIYSEKVYINIYIFNYHYEAYNLFFKLLQK